MTMLQPFISQTSTHPIWRMEFDELTNILVLEIRDQANKQVSFSSIDLNNGEPGLENLTTEERWLAGVEAAYNGVVLLHHYKHESGPEHKGIVAVDEITGKQLWSNYSLAFDHLSQSGPVMYDSNLQPRRLMVIDVKTGAAKSKFDAESDKPLAIKVVIPSLADAKLLPAGSLPDDAYGNIVHYLNHNKYIIVSLHTLKNNLLQQHLFVLEEGVIVYRDLLNDAIQKLQPEAFVLHNNALVYIKNKVELKVLSL